MKKYLAYGVLVAGLLLGGALIAFPQTVTSLAGLAVAQSSTKWNKLKDMAIGDSQSSGVALTAPCLFNGATCDRARGTIAGGQEIAIKSIATGTAPSDAFANPTNALTNFSLSAGFNGATWDRLRTSTADALATTGMLAEGNYIWNGATFDRVKSVTGDAMAATGLQAIGNMLFNGSTWDRMHTISATHNTATTTNGAAQVASTGTWFVTSTPAANTQATASKAAGGGTVRHVATSVTWCFATDTAAGAGPFNINLRDGASGAGTIIRTWIVDLPAAENSQCRDISFINQTGSANTAMTIEFSAAGGAATVETVTLTGYSTP